MFNISRNTIYRWKHLKWETGDIRYLSKLVNVVQNYC
ncbi:hypothetical protein [Orientia tsutsugamushi]